jgi:transglutaminase-like putative cysteine protease
MAHFGNRQGVRRAQAGLGLERHRMTARRMRGWLSKMLSADALGAWLVALALLTFNYGIASSLRDTDTNSFFWICLAAAAISFGLGKIHWDGIQASAGMAALGILFVWVSGARLTQPLLDLLRAAFSVVPQIVPSIRGQTGIDASAILDAWKVIVDASAALTMRLQAWTPAFNQRVTINDALIRNMAWALILWLCAAWMGWFAGRRNAVMCMLPAMSLLAAVTSYSGRRIETLWLLLVLLLLLMGVWNYRNHTLQWLKRRIDFSDSIRFDNSQAVVIMTIAIGAFAFITPSISWRDVLDYIRERQDRNETAEMLGIEQPHGSGEPVRTQQPSLPRDHLLGAGQANSEEIVMFIRTGELPPIPVSSIPFEAPRYYWRSAVYDRYAGSGWVTGTVFPRNIAADTPLIPGLLSGYRLVHMDVQMVQPEGRLFWSGILFSVDVPFTASWRVRPPSDLFADQSALLQADLFAAPTNAETYRAETYVPVPSVSDLRAAGAEYPKGIRERYLQLPSSIPNRVHDLARRITEGLVNPYDKAKAIETYLRREFPYDLEVSSPPDGRDVADYFLFDLEKGYCDYYATAMVVLARSSGLPARFVSGYASGSYDAPAARYIIREANAHSWAEVYFPEIGWVEFEPTASLPQIERTEMFVQIETDPVDEETVSRLLTHFRAEQILLWSSPIVAALVVVFLYFLFIERWMVLRLPPEEAIDRLYQRFYRAGRPLAGTWTSAETSSEFLQKLTAGIHRIQKFARFKNITAGINANARLLTDIYHSTLFIEHRTQKRDAIAAWQTWQRLRRQLSFARFLRSIDRSGTNQR